MRNNPERLAWTVLLAAFAAFVALAVGIPTAISAVLNQSTVAAAAYVRLQAGRIQTYAPPATERDARVVSLEGRDLDEGSTVIVDSDASSQGLITISPAGAREPLVSALAYSGARIQIWRASTPRFTISRARDEVSLIMTAGRAQFTVRPRDAREANVTILTPYGYLSLREGIFTVEVANGEARVLSREGSLLAHSNRAGLAPLALAAGERTALNDQSQTLTKAAPERNLVRNNLFVGDYTPWETEIRSASGSEGRVRLALTGGESSIVLDRLGNDLNWGRTGVFQIIGENVSGRASLRLRIDFKILSQQIKVCGNLGSECPMMVNITFIDKAGTQREWFQGFYADGTPTPDLPDVVRDNPTTRHVAKTLNARESFESENLLLGELRDAQLIQRIRVYAEGHAVQTQVFEVDLLVAD
jgi:hypothetical protein